MDLSSSLIKLRNLPWCHVRCHGLIIQNRGTAIEKFQTLHRPPVSAYFFFFLALFDFWVLKIIFQEIMLHNRIHSLYTRTHLKRNISTWWWLPFQWMEIQNWLAQWDDFDSQEHQVALFHSLLFMVSCRDVLFGPQVSIMKKVWWHLWTHGY